uniref:TSA: Wollemia nobilis Ref_Wollemi_Transcript_18904_1269 transcribed RNA sequence n=1 Tax=Wollemia nobilis TaxID=56998 RepID=A0A0C9RRL2_9CONI
MELRRRLMAYGRSPSRNGDRKISIPLSSPSKSLSSPSKSPSSPSKSPRLKSPSSPFGPGSSPAKALKGLFVRKKSRRESTPADDASGSGKSRQSCDEVSELTEVFRHFDADGDGKISAVELRAVLSSLGEDLGEAEVTAMIKEVDSDGDGFINLTDFIRLNTGMLDGFDAESELKEAFRLFDVDREGCITPKGLHAILTRLGEESSLDDCHMMIKRFDSDGDGVVDFGEFKQMMTA